MDLDREMLDHLKERGSDLTKPHAVEFYVYFPAEEPARKTAPEIEKLGFHVEVLADPSGNRWLCLSIKNMVPEMDSLLAVKKDLDSLARPHGGQCDHWGTQIEK